MTANRQYVDEHGAGQPIVNASASATGSFDRIGIIFPLRMPLLFLGAGLTGFGLGLAHGSNEAGYRFRAENAHRLPQTQTGWYLYHKSKNYHVMLGGIKEGFKMAGRTGAWTGLFVAVEEGVDRGRAAVVRQWRHVRGTEEEERVVAGNRDFVSTMFAGLGTAGAFSAWNRFPLPTAVRLAKMGVKWGLVFGVLQDVMSLVRGRRLGYVEFVRRRMFGGAEKHTPEPSPLAGS